MLLIYIWTIMKFRTRYSEIVSAFHGKAGSYAETYAKDKDMPFIAQ